MSDKYGAEDDPACYPGTTVLRNLLDIRDPDQLQQAEAEFAAAAADAIEIGVGPFDLDYLRQLHRNLFGEVYPWAGQLRQVDISKGNTRFCTWTRIAPEAKRLLAALADGLAHFPSTPSLVILVAEAYGEFNLIHPFREGNGRTQRMFFEHALLVHGYGLSWQDIQREEWIASCVAAVHCDYTGLQAIFRRALVEL